MDSTKTVDGTDTETERDDLIKSKAEGTKNGIYGNGAVSSPGSGGRRSDTCIRYSTEYRTRGTKDIVHSILHQDEKEFETTNWTKRNRGTESPAFEVLAVYEITPFAAHNAKKTSGPEKEAPTTAVEPTYFLRIYSGAIINALRCVVEYYPQVNLNGDVIELRWPYPLLAHHYDELHKFQERCQATDSSKLCEREEDAAEHLRLLLEYLDTHIMDKVKAEKKRNIEGKMTFNYRWVSMKPGTTIMFKIRESVDWSVGVVYSCSGGIFVDPPVAWTVDVWNLEYDGKYLSRKRQGFDFHPYDSEMDSDFICIDRSKCDDASIKEIMEQQPLVKEAVELGEMYWDFLRPVCKEYKGTAWQDPTNEESESLVRFYNSKANL